MTASYNNAGYAARYSCQGAHTSYDAPFCQTLNVPGEPLWLSWKWYGSVWDSCEPDG